MADDAEKLGRPVSGTGASQVTSVSLSLLASISIAERSLGRLESVMGPGGAHPGRLHLPTLRQGDVLAQLQLDGNPLPWDEFTVGLLDPGFPSPPFRRTAAEARALLHAMMGGLRIRQGLTPAAGSLDSCSAIPLEASGKQAVPAGTTLAAVRAAARAATADLEAWLSEGLPDSAADGSVDEAGYGPSEERSSDDADAYPTSDNPAASFNADRLAALWTRIAEPAGSRTALLEACGRMAKAVEDDLALPGVLGAGRAFRRLHDMPLPGGLGSPEDWGDADGELWLQLGQMARVDLRWRFARLLAPDLLRRACGLSVRLYLGEALAAASEIYRHAMTWQDSTYDRWFAQLVDTAAMAQLDRVRSLHRLHATWQDRLGGRRRQSRAVDVLGMLPIWPALTVRRVQAHLGITFAGANDIVDGLVTARILRPGPRQKGVRIFLAADLAR